MNHTHPEEISVELQSKMASHPFRHVRKSHDNTGIERERRGKKGIKESKQSLVRVPHVLPVKDKWKLY